MYQIGNKLVYESIKNTGILGFACHACPQSVSEIPCVTFYEDNCAPLTFANDNVYADDYRVTLDIWAKEWEQADEMTIMLDEALTESGFVRIVKSDNVAFDRFNRRDDQVRKTLRYRRIL